MGVPVVTLRGERHAGRVGASLLSQVEMPYLIANSVEEYVDIAVALANHPARLAELRRSLRPHIAGSPLCDGAAFARKIEAVFRSIWKHWCETPPTAHSIELLESTNPTARHAINPVGNKPAWAGPDC
jgi:protein O-GlcNAc transferase